MKKIHFRLIAEHIKFDTEEQKIEHELLESYTFYSDKINSQEIEELFISLIEIKGDWIAYDLDEDDQNVYVDMFLMYPFFEGKKEENIPNKIYEIVNEFIVNKRYENITDIFSNDEEIDSEGYLLKIREGDGSDFNIEEIKKKLTEAELNFEIVANKQKRVETGAGDLMSEVFIYVRDSSASGITWDILKATLMYGIGTAHASTSDKLLKKVADRINFKRLRKDVALRLNIDSRNITLIDMHYDEEKQESYYVFKSGKWTVDLICDKDKVITEFNAEEF